MKLMTILLASLSKNMQGFLPRQTGSSVIVLFSLGNIYCLQDEVTINKFLFYTVLTILTL